MENNNLKISVVTVCYNAVDCIEETMLSVLDQTYPNIEYIVIDGGSSDGTADIIRKYADRLSYWVSEPDKGIYDAMNKGIVAATGDYINFMNAGDRFASNGAVESVVRLMNHKTTIGYGNWDVELAGMNYHRKPLSWSYIKRQIPFCHQAAFYSTSYHKQHLFPANLKIVGDYKIVFDAYLVDKVKFQYLDVTIAKYDITLGNSTSVDLYRKSLDEKYTVWNIESKPLKKLPHEIGNIFTALSYQIKKRISPRIIIRVKKFKESFRKHNRS